MIIVEYSDGFDVHNEDFKVYLKKSDGWTLDLVQVASEVLARMWYEGYTDGYDEGYDRGESKGYAEGYDDGAEEAGEEEEGG